MGVPKTELEAPQWQLRVFSVQNGDSLRTIAPTNRTDTHVPKDRWYRAAEDFSR